jgi:ABC-type transport system involved in multi-copper enzyme maturation permease subunit
MRNLSILQNPVTIKELRSRMRGRRAFVVLTVYLLLMSGFVSLVYLVYASASNTPFGPDPRLAGKTIFGAIVGVQVLLVIYIGPSFTAGAITGEKERQTYSLLRTTLLPARALVTGKLVSSLGYVFLLIFASVPLQSIAFLLGGVSLEELVVAELLILVSAVAFAMIGLYFSSIMRSTLVASISTFAAALFLTFGLPSLALVILPIAGNTFFGVAPAPVVELLLVYGGLALAATNLPATIIVSEVLLLQEDALFYTIQAIGGYSAVVVSPWTLYLVLYTLLALVLFVLTVRRVRRIPSR